MMMFRNRRNHDASAYFPRISRSVENFPGHRLTTPDIPASQAALAQYQLFFLRSIDPTCCAERVRRSPSLAGDRRVPKTSTPYLEATHRSRSNGLSALAKTSHLQSTVLPLHLERVTKATASALDHISVAYRPTIPFNLPTSSRPCAVCV